MLVQAFVNPWPKYPLVYEINTRTWLAALSARLGRTITLDRVPTEEIDRISRLGFHAVWLMGVWTTGSAAAAVPRSRPEVLNSCRQALPDFTPEDIVGSPYAVSDYVVAPQLGGPHALAALRGRLAQHGLRLILDFVGNHTALDHRFVSEQPAVYVHGSEEDLARDPSCFFKTAGGVVLAHGRDPYFPPWPDTAQINYAQTPGREAMRQQVLKVAAQCDGIRCDMAMLVLPETLERVWGGRLGPNPIRKSFWKEALDELRQLYPQCLLLAESYWDLEWRLQQEGFQFTYDRKLYDRLRQNDFRGVRLHLRAAPEFQDRCARFIETHDDARAIMTFGPSRARSAAVASFFSPGLRLFQEGQLEGHRVGVPLQLGRRPLESEDVETALFYEKILGVLQDPIFQEGSFQQREVRSPGWGDTSNESLLALWWAPSPARNAGPQKGYLVVVNLSGFHAYGRVLLPGELFAAGKPYVFFDRYDGKRYEREGGELAWPGLYVALEGHQPHIFEISAK
ncbi:MAG: alpha-amylase family glycosyl hydrolase [Planctomycetota bacterium]|nr:alpha-amylase family glycosyl hydrolase [Planctomycetota bacterium]